MNPRSSDPEPEPASTHLRPLVPQPLLSLHQPKHSLGCPVLDRLLHGGVPRGSVTELVGECGSGKTQLCLQLSLSSPSSLYLHSEPPFPLRRLVSLSRNPNSLDRVLVRALHSAADLLAVLDRLPPVDLIVVDSIAALFRSEFDNTPKDLKSRSNLFFRIASRLKEWAARFGAAVVVTNQVVDVVDGGDGDCGGGRVTWTSGRRVIPALGLAWGNCVNTRVFLSRGVDGRGRRMEVVFAPHLPESGCEFVIEKGGVFGIG